MDFKKVNDQAYKKISLIGAPTDVGAGRRGSVMAPEALRVAGIEKALRGLGHEVNDRGNLAGPLNPELPSYHGHRHLAETVQWSKLVKQATAKCLANDEVPVMMGGDHSMAIGSIAAIAHHCKNVGKKLNVLWLDAHADFNTSSTSPSGNIHGMPLAVLYGMGHPELLKVVDGSASDLLSHVVQIGIRSVDALEKEQLTKFDVNVFDMRMIDEYGMRAVMKQALEICSEPNSHLHVSFDVDFLDPNIAPGVATTEQGGPNYREAQLCMEMIYDTGLLGSLDIVELNPAYDHKNKTAVLAVELVESLFGKQILARKSLH